MLTSFPFQANLAYKYNHVKILKSGFHRADEGDLVSLSSFYLPPSRQMNYVQNLHSIRGMPILSKCHEVPTDPSVSYHCWVLWESCCVLCELHRGLQELYCTLQELSSTRQRNKSLSLGLDLSPIILGLLIV